jgi:hypothetical protein
VKGLDLRGAGAKCLGAGCLLALKIFLSFGAEVIRWGAESWVVPKD